MLLLLKLLAVFVFYVQSIHCSSGGESTTFRKQDDTGKYAFGYDINDGKGGNNFHKESGDEYGNKRGSYGILGADGKMRIVHYIADHDGFRVDIKSNEQGMKTGVDSANAIVNGKDPEHPPSDYSSEFGMRTPGYSAPVASPLYLSPSNHHPSSKPYYPSSLAYHPPAQHSAHVPLPPPAPSVKPGSIYSSYAHRMHLIPKNLAYTPKSISYSPPLVSLPAPKYGSIYDGHPSSGYESGLPPQPVHPVGYTPESRPYSAPRAYDQTYADPLYGLTSSHADSYHPSNAGGYGLRKSALSAYPQTGFSKVSGYEKRKHRHSTKYLNEPLHAYGSSHSSAAATSHPDASILRPGTLRASVGSIGGHTSPDHAQLVASYRTEQRHSDGSLPVKVAKSPHFFDSSLYKSAKKKK